jgi:hypothetical protein
MRLIDRDKVWASFVMHYWDSVQKDRDLILCHVEAVLRTAKDETLADDDLRKGD